MRNLLLLHYAECSLQVHVFHMMPVNHHPCGIKIQDLALCLETCVIGLKSKSLAWGKSPWYGGSSPWRSHYQ